MKQKTGRMRGGRQMIITNVEKSQLFTRVSIRGSLVGFIVVFSHFPKVITKEP